MDIKFSFSGINFTQSKIHWSLGNTNKEVMKQQS